MVGVQCVSVCVYVMTVSVSIPTYSGSTSCSLFMRTFHYWNLLPWTLIYGHPLI